MSEIKRILSDSRRRLVLALLLLMGLGGYGLGLLGGWLGDGTDVLKEEAAQYRVQLEAIKTIPLSDAVPYLEGREAPVSLELKKTVEHLLDYPDYMEYVQQQAARMSKSKLAGGDPDSFVYRNIQKTAADFAQIRDVEVKLGSQKAVTAWISERSPELFSAMGILLVVISFIDEKKKGLLALIRSCPKGRKSLSIRRMGTLLFFSVFFTFIFSVLPLLISFLIYGGWDDLGCPIQSLPLFGTCMLRVNVGGWIGLYLLVRIFSGFALGVLLWFILSLVKNRQITGLLLALLFAGEYFAYTAIMPQMSVSFLRYINIFACIFPDEMFRSYVNINFFGTPVNTLPLILILMGLLLFILSPLLIFLEDRRYAMGGNRGLERLLLWFESVLDKMRVRLNILAVECYKQLVINGGILILAAGLYICFQLPFAYRSWPADDTDRMLDQFIADMQGPITEETWEKAEGIREALSRRGSYAAEEAFALLEKQLSKACTAAQNADFEPWLINERMMETYLDKDLGDIQRWVSIVPAFFIMLLSSPLFSYENASGTRGLLRGCMKGRGFVFWRKYLLAAGAATLFTGLICLKTYLAYQDYIGAGMINVPVGNIPLLSAVPPRLSLKTFFWLLTGQRILMSCVLASLVLWLSARMRDWLSVAVSGFLFLLLPGLMSFFGIEWTASFSIIPHLSGIEWIWNQSGMLNVMSAGLWIGLAALSVWDNYRRWSRA
ncbi:MAG: hypothetical protein IJR95_00360 [Lachnospiraceae bacterium]|nr:hypothetical protein [Lachnospiraceae bacterium]